MIWFRSQCYTVLLINLIFINIIEFHWRSWSQIINKKVCRYFVHCYIIPFRNIIKQHQKNNNDKTLAGCVWRCAQLNLLSVVVTDLSVNGVLNNHKLAGTSQVMFPFLRFPLLQILPWVKHELHAAEPTKHTALLSPKPDDEAIAGKKKAHSRRLSDLMAFTVFFPASVTLYIMSLANRLQYSY